MKNTTDNYLSVDAKTFKYFADRVQRVEIPDSDMKLVFDSSNDALVMEYVTGDQLKRQEITFKESKTGYGVRQFVICPGCDKPKNTLYFTDAFKCRSCSNLYYPSSMLQRNEMKRLELDIRKLQKRLKMGLCKIYDYPTEKPLHMHSKTFERLLIELVTRQAKHAEKRNEYIQKLWKRYG